MILCSFNVAGYEAPGNPGLLAELDSTVALFRSQAFACTTARTYNTHLRAYLAFCNSININPVPISHVNIARYVAYLASRLSYSSIRQYLNIIRVLHLEGGLPNPLEASWYLQSLLRGCKRVIGDTCKPKLPMTVDLLRKIFNVLDINSHVDIAFWAACLVAFFSFLRKSNLFVDGNASMAYLKRRDVTFLTQGAILNVTHTKTIQHNERQLKLPIPHIAGSPLCPSSALLLVYKMVAAPDNAPLLAYPTPSGSRALSYQHFLRYLKSVLSKLGIDSTKYAGHSFRRGGASLALACNLPPDLIKLQGDWQSDCYQRYLEPDLDTKFQVARAMATGVQRGAPTHDRG